MAEFEPPGYAYDGMEVYIRWSREKGTLLRCKVACAAGNHARVVNENHKVDSWFSLDDLLIPTDELIKKIQED